MKVVTDYLGDVRQLVLSLEALGAELERRVTEAVEAGVDRTALANVLGVHRSTLYRRHVTGRVQLH